MEELDFSELQGFVEGVDDDINQDVDDIVIVDETEEDVEETPAEEKEEEGDIEIPDQVDADIVTDDNVETSESYIAMQALIEAGELEDFLLEIDGEEIQLSEYKNIDKDTFKEVLKTYKNKLKEEKSEEVVSVKDLDETKKALIDIIIKGDMNEVQELLKEPAVFKDPFEGYDNNNQEHNIKVYMAYLTSAKGHSVDEAEALTEIALKNNSIDEKALKIVEAHRENTKKAIIAEKERVEKLEAEKKERIKTYAKDLEETYKEYGLKPEKVLQLKKVATQMDKVGNLPVDEIYENYMRDPKTAADLILFLTDKELYDKRIYAKAKKESDVQTVRKIQLTRVKGKSNKTEETPETRKDSFIEKFENLIIED